jgi:thiol-disulfide isomerase/thioredoxin
MLMMKCLNCRVLVMTAVLSAFLCGPALAQHTALPLLRSHGGQFTEVIPGGQVPDKAIIALDGSVTTLARFRNRVLVLNFWATWCAACRYELPALMRLAGDSDKSRLAVAAVSIDTDGFTSVLPYLARYKVTGLDVFLDPEQSLGSQFRNAESAGALPLFGLPMTYFVDPDGAVLGYVSGAVEWDEEEARRFIGSLLASASS